jgi:hypothetical protein
MGGEGSARDVSSHDEAEVRLNRLLNLILETAVDALGFDAATVSARHPSRGIATVAATDQRYIQLDEAQYESGQGPCVTTLDDPGPIFLEDVLKSGDRWQHFARSAGEMGVRTSLSLNVPTESDELAASLNLYARHGIGMSEQEIQSATQYAKQLAAALLSMDAHRSTARLAKDLADAMQSRAVIEQAKGMVMAEQLVDADEAFKLLVRVSQREGVKVRDLAMRLVEQRTGRT